MIFIWGSKTRRKKLGWVAEFCTTCREPTPFKLFSLRSANHVCFATTSFNGTVGHEARCSKCKTRQPANPLRYSGVSRVAGVNIAVLAEETNPTLSRDIAAGANQQALYHSREQIESHPKLDVAAALLEGYAAVQVRRQSRHIDGWTALACFGIFPALVVTATGENMNSMIVTELGVAGYRLAFLAAIILASTGPARYAKRKIVPGVQGALACLNASPDDVAEATTRLKRLDVDLHKMFSRKVFAQIEASVTGSDFSETPSDVALRKAA